MDYRRSEVLSLWERKVTDKQEEEVRMIHVAMHLRQRRQYKLSFSSISKGATYRNIQGYEYIPFEEFSSETQAPEKRDKSSELWSG